MRPGLLAQDPRRHVRATQKRAIHRGYCRRDRPSRRSVGAAFPPAKKRPQRVARRYCPRLIGRLTLQRHFVSHGASMNHRCRPGPPTRRRLGAAGLQNVAVVLIRKSEPRHLVSYFFWFMKWPWVLAPESIITLTFFDRWALFTH